MIYLFASLEGGFSSKRNIRATMTFFRSSRVTLRQQRNVRCRVQLLLSKLNRALHFPDERLQQQLLAYP